MISRRPYLLRAIYQWILDNRMTPHILVDAERTTHGIPERLIEDGRVVLNLAPQAVQGLDLGDEWLSLKARFDGTPVQLSIPVSAVLAVYARENGEGIVLPVEAGETAPAPEPARPGGRLKVVK